MSIPRVNGRSFRAVPHPVTPDASACAPRRQQDHASDDVSHAARIPLTPRGCVPREVIKMTASRGASSYDLAAMVHWIRPLLRESLRQVRLEDRHGPPTIVTI